MDGREATTNHTQLNGHRQHYYLSIEVDAWPFFTDLSAARYCYQFTQYNIQLMINYRIASWPIQIHLQLKSSLIDTIHIRC